MKNLLRLEELAQFLVSIYAFTFLDFAWWWYPALLPLPDIGMLGYLINTKLGAFTYNLFHHKAAGLTLLLGGWLLMNQWLMLSGIILFGHASMDRVVGYGLKYPDSFQHTHLGQIGK